MPWPTSILAAALQRLSVPSSRRATEPRPGESRSALLLWPHPMSKSPIRLNPSGARGPSVLLRPLRLTDDAALFEAIEVSRRRIVHSVPWSPSIRSVADMRRRIAALHKERRQGESRRYAIVVGHERRVVGSAMLGLSNKRHGTAVAGAWLRQDEWAYGYGSESAMLLCHMAIARMGMERVEFWIDPRNKRSQRVPESLTIPCEGTLRNHWREAGRLVSSRLYAVIRSDFRRLRPHWNRALMARARRP